MVVSCPRRKSIQSPAQRKSVQSQQNFNNIINAQNINNNKVISSSGSIENQNSNNCTTMMTTQTTTPSPHRKLAAAQDQLQNSPTITSASIKTGTKKLINEKDLTNLNRLSTSPKQDDKQQNDQFDEINPNNMNEIEESCLLGIDCNEKTTVGLVLRILGDTTIRLDGDG